MVLIAVRQEAKIIDNSVVIHELELAIKRDIGYFMKVWKHTT